MCQNIPSSIGSLSGRKWLETGDAVDSSALLTYRLFLLLKTDTYMPLLCQGSPNPSPQAKSRVWENPGSGTPFCEFCSISQLIWCQGRSGQSCLPKRPAAQPFGMLGKRCNHPATLAQIGWEMEWRYSETLSTARDREGFLGHSGLQFGCGEVHGWNTQNCQHI